MAELTLAVATVTTAVFQIVVLTVAILAAAVVVTVAWWLAHCYGRQSRRWS